MNPVTRNTLLAFAAFIAALPVVRAATLTWDTTIAADSIITAGSGTWVNGSGNWNNGTTSSGITWNNSTPDAAIFAGTDGTYAITVGGGITSGSLSFNNSGYTLSAASAQTVTVTGIQVASGKSANLGNNVSVNSSGSLIIRSGGTLNIDTGGKITGTGVSNADVAVNGGSTLNVQGGSLTTAANVVVGPSANTDTNGLTNTLNLTSGTITLGSDATFARYLTLGNSNSATSRTSTAVVTVSGGALTVSSVGGGLRFGNPNTTSGGVSNGTFNLNGGTVQVSRVLAATQTGSTFNSTFNFNGGTLKVLTGSTGAASFMTGLGAANVKAGGAIIDTNGVATTIGQALVHDSGLGGTTDGGLTKLGTGTLTLTGVNTFTGNTTVSAGTLASSGSGTFGAGNVTVANGALLTAGNTTSFADSATLTFVSTSTANSINLDFSGFDTLTSINDSGSIINSFIGAGTYTASELNAWFGGSVFTGTGSLIVTAIPEPSTYAALAGLGILGYAACRRRRA